MRKALDLRVEDRVRVRWFAEGPVTDAVEAWIEWLAKELLAVAFERAGSADGLEAVKIPGGHVIHVRIEPA